MIEPMIANAMRFAMIAVMMSPNERIQNIRSVRYQFDLSLREALALVNAAEYAILELKKARAYRPEPSESIAKRIRERNEEIKSFLK